MGKDIKPFRVLFLDDQPQWSAEATKSLRDLFDVVSVSDINQAKRALASDQPFDVAVIDLMLTDPAESSESQKSGTHLTAGLDFLKSLKESTPNMPVVAFSTFASLGGDAGDVKDGRAAFSSYISKSASEPTHTLRETLLRVIAESKKKDVAPREKPLTEVSTTADTLRSILAEEIAKLSPLRERTLSIPDEGNFELIPPLVGYRRKIEERITRHPYAKNVFLMMKFRSSNRDLSDFILDTLLEHGLRGVRADQDEWNITNNAYNPIAVLYCCKYGIALFDEPEESQAYSPNVAYELGMMHCQKKETLILRHSFLPQVPFDLVKDLYVTYERDLQVRSIISRWVSQIPEDGASGEA